MSNFLTYVSAGAAAVAALVAGQVTEMRHVDCLTELSLERCDYGKLVALHPDLPVEKAPMPMTGAGFIVSANSSVSSSLGVSTWGLTWGGS
jgi:hypothetical protein